MAEYKRLDENGLLYFWGKVKALVPSKTSQLTNDSGFLTSHQDISGKLNTTGDGKNVTVSFTTADSRANIVTGEKLSTIFGKIAKYFADLKTVAFTGSYTDLTDKPTIPTNTSDLTNGADFQSSAQVKSTITSYGYQTATNVSDIVESKGYQNATQVNNAITSKGYQTESQVSALINSAVSGITGISFEIVGSLPTTGKAGVIYLLSNSGTAPNVYDEYIWLNTKFEKIGTTAVDLSGYVQASEIVAITNAEIDAIAV